MLGELKVKLFLDCADMQINENAENPLVAGFTTNPSLCRKSGVTNYEAFCCEAAAVVFPKPISFEIFADDFPEMEKQARILASLGDNVNVKIPITNTKGMFTGPVISALANDGIKINVTAIFTNEQIEAAARLHRGADMYLSVFAGRIADTGRSPISILQYGLNLFGKPPIQFIWASTREVWNVWQANAMGVDIITVTPDILAKLPLCEKSLEEFSLETVKMFHDDAQAAGYTIVHPNSYGAGGF